MRVTCKVCKTTKNIKREKLEPYRGKIISTKCANKQCTHRIKFKVPLLAKKNKKTEVIKTNPTKQSQQKQTKETHKKQSKPTIKEQVRLSCPNCQAEITEETRFCVECGQKIVKDPKSTNIEVIKCIKCGRIYKEGEKFCLECGTPKKSKSAESQPLHEKPNKKIEEKTPKPIKKKKNKKGCWSIIWKVVVAIFVIASIAIVAYIVLDDSDKYTLTDGPWEVTAALHKELYGGNVNNRSKEEAIAMLDAEYELTLNTSSIDIPYTESFNDSVDILTFDQYFPYKIDDFYLFTINLDNNNKGEIRIILHLKSNYYFEGRAFIISDNRVSITYIKGTLKI